MIQTNLIQNIRKIIP